ncbi:hypothetical protein, partial [Daejeonella sp.]|uniref:hypothetical protein n=1 Tax=Daejeonella sp. TaxID=2805397 RepID=UPI0039830B63
MKLGLSFLLILFCTVSIAQQSGNRTMRKTITEASNAILDSFENDIRNEIAAKDIAGAAYVL